MNIGKAKTLLFSVIVILATALALFGCEKKEEFLSKERKFHKSLTGIKRIMFHVKHFWRAIGKMQQPEKKQSFFYQIRLLELDEREEFINVVSRKI